MFATLGGACLDSADTQPMDTDVQNQAQKVLFETGQTIEILDDENDPEPKPASGENLPANVTLPPLGQSQAMPPNVTLPPVIQESQATPPGDVTLPPVLATPSDGARDPDDPSSSTHLAASAGGSTGDQTKAEGVAVEELLNAEVWFVGIPSRICDMCFVSCLTTILMVPLCLQLKFLVPSRQVPMICRREQINADFRKKKQKSGQGKGEDAEDVEEKDESDEELGVSATPKAKAKAKAKAALAKAKAAVKDAKEKAKAAEAKAKMAEKRAKAAESKAKAPKPKAKPRARKSKNAKMDEAEKSTKEETIAPVEAEETGEPKGAKRSKALDAEIPNGKRSMKEKKTFAGRYVGTPKHQAIRDVFEADISPKLMKSSRLQDGMGFGIFLCVVHGKAQDIQRINCYYRVLIVLLPQQRSRGFKSYFLKVASVNSV